MTAVRAIVWFLLTGVLVAPVSFQSSVGTLSGRVVDGATGKPVRGASVKVVGAPNYAPQFLTDANGRFQFSDVPPAAVDLIATKHGFLAGSYGQRRPNGDGVSLEVRAGARVEGIELRVWPTGTISGRVVDEYGAPLGSVSVIGGPARDLMEGSWPALTTATTDESGAYSLSALAPGPYVVGVWLQYRGDPDAFGYSETGRATINIGDTITTQHPSYAIRLTGALLPPEVVRERRRHAFSGTWFPATQIVAQAEPIAVGAGEEKLGIDLVVPLLPAFEVSGHVIEAGLQPEATRLMLIGANEISTHALADGSFVFPVVPPGTYELRAVVQTASLHQLPPDLLPGEGRWATQPIVIGNRDVSGLAVALKGGVTVRGRLEFEGAPAPAASEISEIRGGAYSAGNLVAGGELTFSAGGTFVAAAMAPGDYTLRLTSLPSGWTLGSVEWQGQDRTDVPIDVSADVDGVIIRVIQRTGTIAGRVRDERGATTPFAAVLIFPADRQAWAERGVDALKTRRLRPVGGTYEFGDLAPGEYLIIAVDDADLADWPSTDLLTKLSASAQRVTVLAGGRVERELTARIR